MPDCNAHGPVQNWVAPPEEQVQEFFDNLAEVYVRNEPLLIQDTTQAELDYITARAAEAELARQASSAGGVEDEVTAAAEEKELAQWTDFASSPSRYPDPPSADLEDIDTIIEDVAKDAAAEADKIATEEATRGAAEDATKGPAEEPGKAAAEEAGKGPARETGEAVAEEEEERLLQAMGASFRKLQVLHRARMDMAEADLKGRVAEMQTWFRQACEELKAAQDELAKREVELTMKHANIEKAQETVKNLAAEAEAA
nr:tol-Pal system protein TolA-like [Aegilops tauschii subsp. strangulata]